MMKFTTILNYRIVHHLITKTFPLSVVEVSLPFRCERKEMKSNKVEPRISSL